MSQMPWWLTAIMFFLVGMAVERFVIDRKFIRDMQAKWGELQAAIERVEREKDRPDDAP